MNEHEKTILDMLRHFWYMKGYISDQEMERHLRQFMQGKNPFLQFREEWEANPNMDRHVSFDSPWWTWKLAHD